MPNARVISGILALSLASTSCLRHKALTRVFIPPPARSASLPDVPGPLTNPPQLTADLSTLAPPTLPQMGPAITIEIPDAPKRATSRPAPRLDLPKPATGPVPPETAAPPRLAQMFTPEELRQNTRALEDSLEKVNRALTIVEGKSLTAEQKQIAERIRSFRKQAEQAREEDLLTAVSLAKRAEFLATDLLERLP
jgi:hypothetical protein